uniref:WRKY domain-containing protein n=2 Tax=Triticum urartu TaxID=4572 RepID=A0A8R7P9H4_TRIUA
MISNIGQKRRRNNDRRSRSLVTVVPHYDGHHWRKYGQKNINDREHARSYYRCAYTERNCAATKTIQQQDQNTSLNYE